MWAFRLISRMWNEALQSPVIFIIVIISFFCEQLLFMSIENSQPCCKRFTFCLHMYRVTCISIFVPMALWSLFLILEPYLLLFLIYVYVALPLSERLLLYTDVPLWYAYVLIALWPIFIIWQLFLFSIYHIYVDNSWNIYVRNFIPYKCVHMYIVDVCIDNFDNIISIPYFAGTFFVFMLH